MTQPQPIIINNDNSTGAREIINLIGTVIIFGGVGGLVWAVSQEGYAEMAASGFSIMIVQMIKMLLDAGVLAKPKTAGGKRHFTGLSADIRRYAAEFAEWRADRKMWQMAALALGYAIGFLVLRSMVLAALGIFHNVVFAVSAAAIVGGAIAAPSWYERYKKPAVAAGIYNPDALKQAAAPARVPPYVPPVAAPVAQPAPAPTPKKVVVVRRVKKEETDV
ncbi:hypothetical protein [Tsukamurella spumae]|uniref:Uncharacterized protein n=1 Tax=Tsukamurella spumae TaxID=44753 RepID=A0A846X5B3_9ACTN|nr:hypothetical protein [Tsukamurella spumae]NKY20877.1 hypothetical protein [Tsukamurella spumae]